MEHSTMDTKSVRHHKRSKKIKSNGSKGNTDVLVVPPDILKKLGISIGNTDISHQNHNNFNNLPSAETIYNDYTTNDQTKVNNNRESSEASILETANLMKKSVFLSPTFIPTVANVIPGEIEITSIKHPTVMQNVSMDSIEVSNIHYEAITGHETYQSDNQININGHLKINGNETTISEINFESSKFTNSHTEMIHNADENIEDQTSDFIKLSTEKSNKVKHVVTKMESDVIMNEVCTSNSSQTLIENGEIILEDDESNPSEISDSQIKQAERDLISLEGSIIQMDTTEDENSLISFEGTDIQIEQDVSHSNIIHLEGSEIQYKNHENIITLGERNHGNVKNHFIPVDRIVNHEDVKDVNNITFIEGNAIQIEDGNVISIENNAVVDNHIRVENLNSLEEIPVKIDSTEVENDFISLEGSIIQLEQAENIIYLNENAVLQCQAQDENRIVSLETETDFHNENICSLEEEQNTEKDVSKNNIPLEDNLVQKICEDYLSDILTKDGKFELQDDSNTNYDLSEDKVIASLPIVNGDFSELVENEMLIQDVPALEQPVVSIPLKSNHKTQDTVNKISEQIKIISEEILITENIPDFKRSQSPVIRSLTPVPLNAIIGPRSVKHNNIKENITELKLQNKNELCNGTENCYSDTNVDKTIKKEKNEVISICAPEGSETSGGSVRQTKREEILHDNNLIVRDLNDKNIKLCKEDMDSFSTTGSSENTIHENADKSDRNKSLKKSKFNSIRHTYLTLTQDSAMKNYVCGKQPNTKECDKLVFNKINAEDKGTSKDILNINSELESDKQQTKSGKKYKMKTNLLKEERKSITEENINKPDSNAKPDEHIDKILKSSIENSDTNTHLDKVKEIAECIKKFAQMHKEKKKVNKKDDKLHTPNKKAVINSKSNKIKSKLCIQGVEKPGGIESIHVSDKMKFLKTYSRERKQKQQPRSAMITANRNASISIVDTIDIELNAIGIQTSVKQQNFCLCHDFGRLDNCDNSYEHIHFWHHNKKSDLESILSIYNDDLFKHQDRTELDDEKLTEVTQDEADTRYICGNCCLNDNDDDKDSDAIDETEATNTAVSKGSNGNENLVQSYENNTCIGIENSRKLGEAESNIDNNSNTSINLITETKDGNDDSFEIITIIEMEGDDKNVHTTKPHEAIEDDLKSTEEKTIGDNKRKSDENNQEASTSNVMKSEDVIETIIPTVDNNQESSRKRKLSASQSEDTNNIDNREPTPKRKVKCGVCDQLLSKSEWDLHVTNVHFGVGWKADSHFNCDDPVILKRLKKRLRTVGCLQCPVCDLETKRFNKFIAHLETCLKDYTTSRATTSTESIICGVCKQNVKGSWIEHIEKEHNYIAWIDGSNPLNLDDEEEVSKHLQNISKLNGGLICHKCGLKRKRAKIYLAHLESCDGTEDCSNDTAMSTDLNYTRESTDNESVPEKKSVKCGVCAQDVPVLLWTEHIGREHNYLAWEDGTPALNLDNEEEVWNHLQEFIRNSDGLKCYKCGLNRKRVKLFLSHIKTCDGVKAGESYMSLEDVSMEQESPDEKKVECAVCNAKVSITEWNEHIGRNHNYLAWRIGTPPLDVNNPDAVKEHLLDIIRNCEGLICYKCGLNRRRVKLYLSHIETCDGSKSQWEEPSSSLMLDSSLNSTLKTDLVQCGVCDQELLMMNWIDHIQKEHGYMAWLKTKEPLDLSNKEMVHAHLIKISREYNGLICNKCGVTMKYPKCFLLHVKDCTGPVDDDSKLIEDYVCSFDVSDIGMETVICGVCSNEINKSEWLKHLDEEHDYCAWVVGKPPVDFENPALLQRHLTEVSKYVGGLKCKKCGLIRKYAKVYLQHIKLCEKAGALNNSLALTGTDPVECAVCSKSVDPKDWHSHAMEEHYNVAWIVGTTPIEINSPYSVEPFIKEYQRKHKNKLVCKTCGVSRISAVGFYAHIIICGKTEEETEIYRNLCDICNCKYLRIYKSQHMTMHREAEYEQERRILMAKAKELKKEVEDSEAIVGGRRKAAEKAKTVIEKYTSNRDEEGIHCSKCGFTCETDSEMNDHVCVGDAFQESDSDASVDFSDCGDDDDDDDNLSDLDSNISDEELEAQYDKETKSKKHGDHGGAHKIQRLPYQIPNINNYMRKSAEQYISLHLTNDDLFPQYRRLDYEVVPETELKNYMPPLEESCKVKYDDKDEWTSFKRFEAIKTNDVITLFSGACIQSICWIPPIVEESESKYEHYMCVVTHLDSDVPRHLWHEKLSPEPALIQIWDCGNLLSGVPEFAMGVALDCGVVWAIDWCPSGARDVINEMEKPNETNRLGLFAVACSNGSAYMFAMPHPSPIKEKGHQFCKIKPILEMRLAANANRNVHQATAIRWSSQKGHAHVVVGYSDGTVAYFDLLNESPLLRTTENDVTILYPYYDERAQSMCIEDLDLFPRISEAGGVVTSSVAGVSVRGVAPGSAHAPPAHVAATRVRFAPHWPSALLAGDDNLVSQAVNEVEWYGAGRRVGSMRVCCSCVWCGRVASASAPLVRLMRTHPAYNELHRQVVATVKMIPFGNKRKRKNDELTMIMEPLTYNDAVMKYGIEFQRITAKDKITQQKLSGLPRETYPERFPLSDVIGMMFCPSARNHHKLTMATHSGLIFIINV